MSSFDPRGYWEQRLGGDWSLQGVGFRRLGRSFNAWAYRVRGDVFRRVAAEYLPQPSAADVLDVGSGTGFYVQAWTDLGVRSVTGLDLTDAAVSRLRERFPAVLFVRADISEGVPELAPGSFDAVSAMDVLFHVVSDDAFRASLRNVHDLLRPGGTFIWSDAFLRRREIRKRHVSWRRLADTEAAVRAAGLEVVERRPLFVLMNEPLDAPLPALAAWYAAMGVVSVAEPVGELAGRLLYRWESRLVRRRTESPSTEVMVCRRPN